LAVTMDGWAGEESRKERVGVMLSLFGRGSRAAPFYCYGCFFLIMCSTVVVVFSYVLAWPCCFFVVVVSMCFPFFLFDILAFPYVFSSIHLTLFIISLIPRKLRQAQQMQIQGFKETVRMCFPFLCLVS